MHRRAPPLIGNGIRPLPGCEERTVAMTRITICLLVLASCLIHAPPASAHRPIFSERKAIDPDTAIQIQEPERIEDMRKPEEQQLVFSGGDDGGPARKKPVRREEKKVGRNAPCPCGSGKKYKKCCGLEKAN